MGVRNIVSTAICCWALATAQKQVVLQENHLDVRPVNVAFIGAGAAGASSAYHLSKFAAAYDLPVNITVLERNARVGGRSTTVDAYGNPAYPVELGASIFVQVNRILVDAVREFNLSTSAFLAAEKDDIPGASLGIWNGDVFVFTQNGGGAGWWDTAKLLWKYGLAPLWTVRLMKAVVGKFLTMYDEPIFPFESLTQAAQDAQLLAVTAATGEQYMRENGITGLFGPDIVQASTRVNYAQNLAYIHGLEAMVCMATDGAMAVAGGNWRIFDHMVRASRATTLLETAVTGVQKLANGSFAVDFRSAPPAEIVDGRTGSSSTTQIFDTVVLAAPYQFADLALSSATALPDRIPYVQLHVTLFSSPHLMSPAFFNLSPDQAAPKVVLTTLPEGEKPNPRPHEGVGSPGFFSISLLRPVTNPSTGQPEYLYKIFSQDAINSTFLFPLLGLPSGNDRHANGDDDDELYQSKAVTWLYRKVWNSYPYEFPRVTFDEPQRDGWFYTGGMDSFISTMETNALMGRNVAALLVREWEGKRAQRRDGAEA